MTDLCGTPPQIDKIGLEIQEIAETRLINCRIILLEYSFSIIGIEIVK